jgi:Rrf2 family protein
MMLTRGGEYAVRCVLYLSMQEVGRIVPKKEIALAMDIPASFLAKVAQVLAKSRIINIHQGSGGGYTLALRPGDVSLLQVVEALEGEIFLNACIMSPDMCQRSPQCGVHKAWRRARDRLRETLAEVDFEQLSRDELCIPKT